MTIIRYSPGSDYSPDSSFDAYVNINGKLVRASTRFDNAEVNRDPTIYSYALAPFTTNNYFVDAHGADLPAHYAIYIDLADAKNDQALYDVEVVGSDNSDVLIGGRTAENEIAGSKGADRIIGGRKDDSLQADDFYYDDFVADTIRGGAGSDQIYGGKYDRLFGGSGNDFITASGRFAKVDGGLGYDNLEFIGKEKVKAGTMVSIEHVTIGGFLGAAYVDLSDLLGGKFITVRESSKLRATDHDDLIQITQDDSQVTGGGGADTFMLAAADSQDDLWYFDHDRITDFSSAEHDKIGVIKHAAFDFVGSQEFDGSGAELRYSFSGQDTIVQADVDGDRKYDMEVTLTGHHQLHASDFLATITDKSGKS